MSIGQPTPDRARAALARAGPAHALLGLAGAMLLVVTVPGAAVLSSLIAAVPLAAGAVLFWRRR